MVAQADPFDGGLTQALIRHGFSLRFADADFVAKTRVVAVVHDRSGLPADLVLGGHGIEELFAARCVRQRLVDVSVPVARVRPRSRSPGPGTCSASEILINGLRPFVDVVTFGATSCGKPYCYGPLFERCESSYFILSCEVKSANGESDFYDGLTPSCPVQDAYKGELGTAEDALIAAALAYVDDATSCGP